MFFEKILWNFLNRGLLDFFSLFFKLRIQVDFDSKFIARIFLKIAPR